MAKTTTQSDDLNSTAGHCWVCDKTKSPIYVRWTCIPGIAICNECDSKIKRKKPPNYKAHPKLRNYIQLIEKGAHPAPFKMRITLKNGIKITGPVELANVGPLTDASY